MKDILNQAAAIAEYARRAKDNTMLANVTALKLDAERRLGEMLAEQKRTVGLAKAGRPKKIPSATEGISTPTLKSQDIDFKLSARSQKLAALPAKDFDAEIRLADAEQLCGPRRVGIDSLPSSEGELADRGQIARSGRCSWQG